MHSSEITQCLTLDILNAFDHIEIIQLDCESLCYSNQRQECDLTAIKAGMSRRLESLWRLLWQALLNRKPLTWWSSQACMNEVCALSPALVSTNTRLNKAKAWLGSSGYKRLAFILSLLEIKLLKPPQWPQPSWPTGVFATKPPVARRVSGSLNTIEWIILSVSGTTKRRWPTAALTTNF